MLRTPCATVVVDAESEMELKWERFVKNLIKNRHNLNGQNSLTKKLDNES